MKTRRKPRFPDALFWFAALAATLAAQAPGRPGRLSVNSTPKGAAISINGRKMGQPTNATFVVSPGTYKVSVSGSGNLSCPAKSVEVSAGATAELECTAAGWTNRK